MLAVYFFSNAFHFPSDNKGFVTADSQNMPVFLCHTNRTYALYRKGNWNQFNLNSIQFWLLFIDVFKAEVNFFILDTAPYTLGRVSLPAGSCFLAWSSSQPLDTVLSNVEVNKAAASEKSCTTHPHSLPLTEPPLLNSTVHCILWMEENHLNHSQNTTHFGKIAIRALWMAEKVEGSWQVVQLFSVKIAALNL